MTLQQQDSQAIGELGLDRPGRLDLQDFAIDWCSIQVLHRFGRSALVLLSENGGSKKEDCCGQSWEDSLHCWPPCRPTDEAAGDCGRVVTTARSQGRNLFAAFFTSAAVTALCLATMLLSRPRSSKYIV